MIQQLHKRKASGFTIIEVMIVLAIAGLIMLIVFLAVPALQRNAHNTSIKNDVAGLLAGVNEYVNNNDGAVPTGVTNATSNSVDITGGAGTNNANVKLGYIPGTSVSIAVLSGTVSASTAPLGSVKIYTNAICSNTTTATSTGATSRNVAALYQLEGGALECQAS